MRSLVHAIEERFASAFCLLWGRAVTNFSHCSDGRYDINTTEVHMFGLSTAHQQWHQLLGCQGIRLTYLAGMAQ